MIDVKQPLRTAYYQLLNGFLTFNSAPVPVSDDARKLIDSGVYPYVLLSSQSGVELNTLASFDSQEDIILDIVDKSLARTNKQNVDAVANQIVQLVCPNPAQNGLPGQPGISINNVRLSNDNYITLALNTSNSVIRRLLTFRQYVRQTGTQFTPVNPVTNLSIYISDEIPSGVINGVNKVFTTVRNFINSSVSVTVNGLEQKPGLHYTLSAGNTITFADAPQTAVQSGNAVDDIILVTYIST